MSWFFRSSKSRKVAAEPRLRLRSRARIVCPNCSAVNPSGSRYCNQCGQRLDLDALARTASATITPPEAEYTTESDEERRVVTILFADLVDSTALGETLDAEELRRLLSGYFALMTERIHKHGGVVEKFIGDAVMGVFGLPRAHEDDPIRAIRAALEMQDALAQFNAEQHAGDNNGPALRMRIGVNTGEVVAATGPAEGRDFLVTGDAVNVAARLQQIAEPGAVVVGPRTYRSTQSTVDYHTLPPAQLKGKPRPIRVWQAIAMTDTNPVALARVRSLETPSTPLIGRSVELDLIDTIYARVIGDRQPHIVTILGATGVGKTRLAREFIAQTAADEPQPTVLVGRCALYGEGVTFWPLIEMIRDYCGISATAAPEEARTQLTACIQTVLLDAQRNDDPDLVLRYIAYTLGIETTTQRAALPSDPKTLQDGIMRAWRSFFESLAHTAPLILLVDDIHWADDVLLDLLDSVASHAAGMRIFIICTARPELLQRRATWGGGRNYAMLALEPLTNAEGEQLIEAIMGCDAIKGELRANILRRAEGNPFFIEEIVRMLSDRGVLEERDGQLTISAAWSESDEAIDPVLPDTVQGVLAARIDLLSPEERDTLSHAAIIGRTFWPSAVASMTTSTSRARLDAILRDLVTKDLIAPATESTQSAEGPETDEPRYSFKHILTREVAYDIIPRARRAHEHEHFATWLEGFAAGREGEYADVIARNYEEYYRQAGLARSRNSERRRAVRAKIVHYYDLAGDIARGRYAPHAAIRYYSRAITLLRELGDEPPATLRIALLTLHRKRGDARTLLSDGDGAWNDFRAALQQWLLDDNGEPRLPETLAHLDTTERELGMRLYRRLVLLPARYNSWFRQSPSHEELRGYLQAGLQLADEAGNMDSLDRASLLTAKTFFWWSWSQGRSRENLQDALESAEEAVAITERLQAPRRASEALDALGNMQATTTDLRGYLRSQTRRLYWAQRIDDPNEIIDIHCEVSSAHQMVGEYAQAIDHARIALQRSEGLENDVLRAQALQRLTIGYEEWDRWNDAINDGEQMIAIAARSAFSTQNHYRWGVLAVAIALTRMGQIDRADSIMRRLDDLPGIRESQYITVFRGRLDLARGKIDEAERSWRGALENTAGRHIFPALLAELAELGARQGRADLIDAFVNRAVDVGERSGARKPLAQALRARGIVAMTEQRYPDAEHDLTDALDNFIERGTRWEEARTRYVLAELWRRRTDPTIAHSELEHALHGFEQVGAVRDIARAKNALAGGEIRLP